MIEDQDVELSSMIYNPRLPIDVVLNAVKDFVDFAALGKQPFTASQTIAKAYIILNQMRRFKLPLTEWNRKPDTSKYWDAFKRHFRTAHKEFRETTNLKLEESDLERSNANLV